MTVDPETIKSLRAQGLGTRRIAEKLGVTRWAVRQTLAGRSTRPRVTLTPTRAETVKVTVSGDEASVVLPTGASLGDLEALLSERGLDPGDWHVERVTVNEWEALAHGGGAEGTPKVVKLRQLKAQLRNRKQAIGPAVEVAERYRPEPGKRVNAPKLVAVLGDQQAPYHDPELHRAVLRWLSDVQPDEMIFTGDTLDLPSISRYRDRLRWNASAQECVNSGYGLLSDYVDANPNSRRRKLKGNHDERLETEMMQRAERMAFLTPAEREGASELFLYSIRRLLHLDELGIELASVEGEDWRKGEAVVVPGVSVCHEPPSRDKALRLNRSVLAGHTHRQSIRNVTTFDEYDYPVVRTIVEVGCLADTSEGQGYSDRPDWQAGFATVAIHDDGSHSFDLATWRDGSLTWRGDRWGG